MAQTTFELRDEPQWCEAHAGNCKRAILVRRRVGREYGSFFICRRCAAILNRMKLLELHTFAKVPCWLLVGESRSFNADAAPKAGERAYEIELTKEQAMVLRAYGFRVIKEVE